jgi:hypothetical protein
MLAFGTLTDPTFQRPQYSNCCHEYWSYFLGLFGLFGVSLVLSCIFGPIWVYPNNYYFPHNDESNLWFNSAWAKITEKFILKIYTDTAVYYMFFFMIAILAAVAHVNDDVRKFLHRRVDVSAECCKSESHPAASHAVSSWFGLYPYGATYGELLLITALIGLFIFWAVYFSGFIKWREVTLLLIDDPYIALNIAARVSGHLGTLAFALTLMPAARNSMWEAAFGVAFDRTIKYHRVLGVWAYFLSTLHMLLWWIKWAIQGIFWKNLMTLHNMMPGNYVQYTPGNATSPTQVFDVHFDNFSVAMAEFAWIMMTGMLVVALFWRRQNYELFLYSHHLALGVLITVVAHAWCAWYFLLPPLLLWLLDKSLRLARTRSAVVLAMTPHPGNITSVAFAAFDCPHRPGSWVWVNFPVISTTQVCPVAIAKPLMCALLRYARAYMPCVFVCV